MSMSSTSVLNYVMPSLQGCLSCIFVIYVVTSTSMQNSLRDVAVFEDLGFCQVIFPAVILMPCKHDATVISMLVLRYFSKDVLNIWLCSIHPCPWLHLYLAIDCSYLAPKLLNNVAVSMLTLSSVLPCVLPVIHAPYEHVLAILSFTNMSYNCYLPCHAMKCSVVSGTNSPTCLLIVVPAMFESVI